MGKEVIYAGPAFGSTDEESSTSAPQPPLAFLSENERFNKCILAPFQLVAFSFTHFNIRLFGIFSQQSSAPHRSVITWTF